MSSSRIPAFALALVLGAILAGGNVFLAQRFAPELLAFPPIVAWLAGAPIVIGLVLAAALHRPAVAAPAPAAAPPPPDDTPRSGCSPRSRRRAGSSTSCSRTSTGTPTSRSAPPCAASTRPAGRRCASCVALEPVLPGAEDEAVTVSAGFDPARVRLTGNVRGEPPFRGVLRHARLAGDRGHAASAARPGSERVIAPAEVEIA